MIKIAACLMCKHFRDFEVIKEAQNPEESDEVKNYCQAFPEGIPEDHFKWTPDDEECANGLSYETDECFRPVG